jgi:hypothetical protein
MCLRCVDHKHWHARLPLTLAGSPLLLLHCVSRTQVGLVAFRDPHGIRPLVIGKRPSADSSGIEWAIASEDCAFGPIAFERVRDVQPGEMVIITPEGQLISKQVSRVLPSSFSDRQGPTAGYTPRERDVLRGPGGLLHAGCCRHCTVARFIQGPTAG